MIMTSRPHIIRCAHCKGVHATVAQVRECSGRNIVPAATGPAGPVAPWDRDPELARPARPRRAPVTEDGMYLHEGRVYKVQVAKQGSGRLYAKRLDEGTFVYESGAIYRLSADERMTLAQAQEYGRLYGICCRCGAELTDEKSIEDGIGPVCATKWN